MKGLTWRATVALATGKQRLRFFRILSLVAPFFYAGYMHGSMKHLSLLVAGRHGGLLRSRGGEQNSTLTGSYASQIKESAVAPRAYWKGYLKLSLVSCPILLFPATSEREKVSFHQINKATGHRIKYLKVDSESGDEVQPAEIVKGYEVSKGEYIEIQPEELEAIAPESKRTIEIDQFVPKEEIDELYIRDPYYIVPDGEVGEQAFAVIREAIRKEGMVAIGTVVFTSRRHMLALEARGKGLLGMTLRYPYEVHKEKEYFGGIGDEKVPKDMLELASHIVETKRGKFEPAKFEDDYEEAVKALILKKKHGEKVESAKADRPSNVVNLMDALRQSLGSNQPPKKATRPPAKKPVRTGKTGKTG
jgi:DNA end-binding protein Ku